MSAFKDYYQFTAPTRVIAGRDMLASAGFEFAKEGASRVLVVCDPTIVEVGLLERLRDGLRDGGLELAAVYDAVPQDSEVTVVAEVAELAREQQADAFLALGGGSVIDTAKLANVIFTHGGEPRDWEGYYGLPREHDGAGRPVALAPLAAVPTTAGTGSEVSFAAVIRDRAARVKFQVGDFPLIPRLAILDPACTETLPSFVAAATGMDAVTHAIEGYVSSDANPHGDAYALHALRLAHENLERAVLERSDEDARGNMLIAANLAIAPTVSGALGIAHSLSHPCGALFDVPHGVANAINLPWTIEYNADGGESIARRYGDLAAAIGIVGAELPPLEAAQALADHVRALVRRLGLPSRLGECGVLESAIAQLVEAAIGDACTLVNPREPSTEDLTQLYRKAL